jgi:hypothetical protein
MDGAFSRDGRDEKCVQNFGWNTWRQETTRKPRRRWEDNITIGTSGGLL